jgi:hypothetical protein
MMRILPIATAVVALVVCGVVHGLWTDRWVEKTDPDTIAARFETLPLQIGDWEGKTVEVSPREMQGLSGYLVRRYEHRLTHDVVTVALMCGRPRIVSIHTPDVCYAASGYEVAAPEKFTARDLSEPAEFWTSEMVRTRAAEQSRLRIFYAWTATGEWAAADTPRVTYAGTPVLFKLYLLRELPAGNAPLADDPCQDFFRKLQPELRRCLFSASPPS